MDGSGSVHPAEAPGRNIVECLGPVQGDTVRAEHLGADIIARLRTHTGRRRDPRVH
ncbi:MAG: YbjQ family protein [candidate division WS1 bacterium]|nr:YbjQ family protein [candidate division WS1 bacterium]